MRGCKYRIYSSPYGGGGIPFLSSACNQWNSRGCELKAGKKFKAESPCDYLTFFIAVCSLPNANIYSTS